MPKRRLITLCVIALLTIIAYSLKSAERGKAAPGYIKIAKEKITVVGKLVCLGCELKHRAGSNSQCSVHGCRNVLKVVSATNEDRSKPYDGLKKDEYIHILTNEAGNMLVVSKVARNKTAILTGYYYPDAHVIEIIEKPKIYTCNCRRKNEYIRSSSAPGCPCGPKCRCEKKAAALAIPLE